MIFIVDDTLAFHTKNLKQNYSHYSYFATRLPPGFTDGVVQNAGSNIYFNPLIPLSSLQGIHDLQTDLRRIKYGVISVNKALEDLTCWKTFALAGRLQKPILQLNFQEPNQITKQIEEAVTVNRRMALLLAIFMHF